MKSVSILIPAYNEESNIGNLLRSILKQKTNNYYFHDITVISDGSKDNTTKEVLKIKDSRLILVRKKERAGKAIRINQYYQTFDGDILVQFDADILLPHDEVINELVFPLVNDSAISVCFGKQVPYPPKTFIEKLAYFGFFLWEEAIAIVGDRGERYHCFGQIMAFSKGFIKTFQIPPNAYSLNDVYIFYYSKSKKLSTVFQEKAYVYFRLANNYRDYVKQMTRFLNAENKMEGIFGETMIRKYETITPYVKLMALLRMIFKNPLYISVGYVLLQIIPKMIYPFQRPQAQWDIAKSSKNFQ